MTKTPRFLADESGAVAVDWVVLTAGLAALGFWFTTYLEPKNDNMAGRVADSMAQDGIIAVSMGGALIGPMDTEQLALAREAARGLETNEALSDAFRDQIAIAVEEDEDLSDFVSGTPVDDDGNIVQGPGGGVTVTRTGPDGSTFQQAFGSMTAYQEALSELTTRSGMETQRAAILAEEATTRGVSWNPDAEVEGGRTGAFE